MSISIIICVSGTITTNHEEGISGGVDLNRVVALTTSDGAGCNAFKLTRQFVVACTKTR